MQVLGAVNDAHPAFAEDRVDPVALRDEVADGERGRRGRLRVYGVAHDRLGLTL